jgi:hypothetical protein
LRLAGVVAASVLGTGGCGTILIGAAQLLAASNAAVTRRLDTIDSKLDGWRDEQHASQARVGATEKEVADLRSRVGGLEEIVRSYRDECRATRGGRNP